MAITVNENIAEMYIMDDVLESRTYPFYCTSPPKEIYNFYKTRYFQKKGIWIKEQGSKLKNDGPMANKQIIILLYTNFINYVNFSPFFIAFN